jgi:hypothetical protein
MKVNFNVSKQQNEQLQPQQNTTYIAHHAEGRVDPKVNEGQNGFRFWMPQSM